MAVKRRRERHRQRGEAGNNYRRLLAQLVVCLVLFAATFVGRTALPESLRARFRSNTDFVGAFSGLGEALAIGEPVGDSLNDFAVSVFGVTTLEDSSPELEPAEIDEPSPSPLGQAELVVAQAPESAVDAQEQTQPQPEEIVVSPEPQADPPAVEQLVPTLPVEPAPAYTGEELPPKASMEKPTLEVYDTVLPVYGAVSSDFGWRTDPFTGEETFHYGTDIAAETGTDIQCYAAGVVEYIGEADDFGLYIKVRHQGGVTSFYAHCSELLYRQGAAVEAGAVIARVGSTGRSTGSHLHFELRQGETYLNPVYYLDLVE